MNADKIFKMLQASDESALPVEIRAAFEQVQAFIFESPTISDASTRMAARTYVEGWQRELDALDDDDDGDWTHERSPDEFEDEDDAEDAP